MCCRWFCSSRRGFSFSFVRTKKKKQKEKRRLRSGAKKSSYFPKRKELASLKQLFVLNGKYSIFLHAPPLRPEEPSFGGHIASLVVWMYTRSFTTLCSALYDKKERSKKGKNHPPTSEAMLRKKTRKVRPHFLGVKRR